MPFGYLEFSRAIGRDLCPPARVCVRARTAAGGGRPAGAGAGHGLGAGSVSGSGSLPGLVLFESGLAGMDCKHTRSAPDPNRPPTRPLRVSWTANNCDCWAANRRDCWVKRLHPFVGFGPVGPSWNAINSAPYSQLKNTPTTTPKFRINSLSLCVLNWEVEF